jgi:hypothetical protein
MTPSTPRRGLTIRSAAIPEVNGALLLEPLKLEGEEGINALFEYRLVLQSAEGGGGKLDISMNADRITLSAKEEVVINGGGSYTIWNASGITSGTTGTHTVQAASHDFLPGQSMPVQPLPETTPFNEMVELRDQKGRPVAGLPYRLELGNHREVRGVTDSQGRTQRIGSGEAAAQLRMHHERSQ